MSKDNGGSAWQPIETAPKQIGCEILVSGVAHGERYYDIISWRGKWCTFSPQDDAYTWPVGEPTHWMPLPEPPKGGDA